MSEPRYNGEIHGASFDEVYRDLLYYLTRFPDYTCAPRGQKIKEQLATTLVLTDPRRRLIMNPERQMNYGFGVGEFLWYWQGKDDLETMLYYNKRMKDFSDDGKTLNSAYGKRLRKTPIEEDGLRTQWDVTVMTLLADPDSRRAVMHINEKEDQYFAAALGSKDVPCTMSLQFFVRDGELHLHVLMRSNDVMWGLAYDLFSFTLFQECMLHELRKHDKFRDLELGNYYHTAGSMHLYERHFEQADRIIDHYNKHSELMQAEPMAPIRLDQLDDLCVVEKALRERTTIQMPSAGFTGGVHWMLDQLNEHRRKRDKEEGR